jgi:hypothetical protein
MLQAQPWFRGEKNYRRKDAVDELRDMPPGTKRMRRDAKVPDNPASLRSPFASLSITSHYAPLQAALLYACPFLSLGITLSVQRASGAR